MVEKLFENPLRELLIAGEWRRLSVDIILADVRLNFSPQTSHEYSDVRRN